ncbi:MAG: DNA mismatch repair endonuclease MutL [Candidatus Dormibacteraeota bacterium]|nr:DNA mismatch repair endonuclease MutL [Candidatus Dormibacteraeota bacterium]
MIASARIVRLSQVVADAIAAGEVVERPASVVKELVENALDAGARRVDVSIHGGGLIDIEVSDDGAGIVAGDLELAVARHATSKITRSDDLARVRTLGFRGEALASIAAVSDLTIVSRDAASGAGARLRVRFGEPGERTPVAAPVGTRITVGELFATTPARLRFLRSAGAESAAVLRLLGELALLHHDVAFSLRSDDREQLRTPGGSLRDALHALYGPRAVDLLDIDGAGEVVVGGAVSAPHAHRGQRGALVVGVNRRRIQHRGVQVAVEEAYRGLLPVNRYPHGVVLIVVDPAEVDVNVHPTKREVRFRDERRVFTAVQRACWAALQVSPLESGARMLSTFAPAAVADYGAGASGTSMLELADAGAVAATAGAPAAGGIASLSDLRPLRAVGQVGGRWLVAESHGSLVIVDPHAAHEKSIYQELLERWSRPGSAVADTQMLLIPAVVSVDAAGLERVERHRDFVAACGFDIEPFGPDSLRCAAVPAAASGGDAGRLVLALLDALGDDAVAVDVRTSRVAATVACHSAVRFGDRLDAEEQQRLLDRLVETPGGVTCPHGRPTVVVLDDPTLRRTFGRPSLPVLRSRTSTNLPSKE